MGVANCYENSQAAKNSSYPNHMFTFDIGLYRQPTQVNSILKSRFYKKFAPRIMRFWGQFPPGGTHGGLGGPPDNI